MVLRMSMPHSPSARSPSRLRYRPERMGILYRAGQWHVELDSHCSTYDCNSAYLCYTTLRRYISYRDIVQPQTMQAAGYIVAILAVCNVHRPDVRRLREEGSEHMSDSNQPGYDPSSTPQTGAAGLFPAGQIPPQPGYPPQYPTQIGMYGQQPTYPSQPAYPPQQYVQPPTPPTRRRLSGKAIAGIGCLSLVICACLIAVIGSAINGGSSRSASEISNSSATSTSELRATPAPTESAAQYRSAAKKVSVTDISKEPNSYTGKSVTFVGVLAYFIPDSNGNNAYADVVDPNDYSTDIVIQFSSTISLKHLNKGDTITVWGQGAGSQQFTTVGGGAKFIGVVQELYLHDATSGYKDDSIKDPTQYISTHS